MSTRVFLNKKNNQTYVLIGAGIIAGLAYTVFSDGLSKPMPVINSIIIGILLGTLVSFIESNVFTAKLRRNYSFLPLLGIRVAIYSAVILVVLILVFSVSRVFWFNLSYLDVLRSAEFQEYIFEKDFIVVVFYSIGMIGLVVFTYQITRKLGQGYLENIITGKYYDPQREERVFCFVRIHEVERIAKELGAENHYSFINDLIYDITNTILFYDGIIYHYVDGEMVIFWAPKKAYNRASCIRCYFALTDQLFSRREYYLETYNHFPYLLAGMHLGTVIHGEIGHGRTEISFYGDVLNTTSRILNMSTIEAPLLISQAVLDKIELPQIYECIEKEDNLLEGKSNPVRLYSIREKVLKNRP
ncbi:adenylate/guanylate cyclase domain-containing protein [Fulvivirga sedimenti]|uniref:Adenylate/guanylate cyclase domain-containing protein n=1 Tax=Fulvivirga sedimenti TaxID=2879465 RepID=A0A9X1HNI7_9BACT|nr:adenylate/guanylate cyclase domain-containing protein [Fulvivirga sedimenti]MCA6074078.1 adenylate/guanylate cyclase domain-containing protein [Fulvivirga sedimenti]